ncbi:MAG: hypothetical protein ACOC58_02470 [Chloroflexota bacterium]
MKRKYGALRTVAIVFTIIAWIVLILGVIGAIAAGVVGIVGDMGVLPSVGIIIGGIIMAVVYFLFLLAFAQLIYLLVDVERNTRETAYRLRGNRVASEVSED